MSSRRSPATPLANALRGEEKNPDKPGETKLPWSLHVGVVNHLLHVGVLSCFPSRCICSAWSWTPLLEGLVANHSPQSWGCHLGSVGSHSAKNDRSQGPLTKVPRQL